MSDEITEAYRNWCLRFSLVPNGYNRKAFDAVIDWHIKYLSDLEKKTIENEPEKAKK